MTEPVWQGYAVAEETVFLIANAPSDTLPSLESTSTNRFSLDSLADDEEFTINENFLANSTLRVESTLADSASIHISSNQYRGNAQHLSDALNRGIHLPGLFTPESLPHHLNHDWNESHSMFLQTEELGKVGLFSGDWALVSSPRNDNRLVQMHTLESSSTSSETVFASPTLFRNCNPGYGGEGVLSIRATPFGFGPPSMPTAKSATLARIASPLSLNRALQNAMCRSLKSYFLATRRLVKKGDVIAVPVCTDYGSALDEAIGDGDVTEDSYEELSEKLVDEECQPNSVGYFIITNLDYDVVENSAVNMDADVFSGSISGELGCWIDSSVTRVVQTGIEHSSVPDVVSYMGINPFSERLHVSDPYRKLYGLVLAALRENVATFGLGLSVLLKGSAGSGMTAATEHIARRLGFHILDISAYDIIGETDLKTEALLKEQFTIAMSCSPCILLLQDIDALTQATQVESERDSALVPILQDCMRNLDLNWKHTGFPVIVIATSNYAERLPAGFLSCFKQEIDFEAPNESERYVLLMSMLGDECLASNVSLRDLAIQTAALSASDLLDLVSQARLCSIERTTNAIFKNYPPEADVLCHPGLMLIGDDFANALTKARISFSQNIGAPSIPNVSWDDVGGLSKVKEDILDTIQLPLDHPELFVDGLKQRSGILLYGPPGTGKTLLAKAVATSCSLNFFSVKGPELLNMYIGESEANVRRVFQRAREAKPCVIFFDELDSVAPRRGNHGDSGGVMDRIVSQLLAELDGMSSSKGGTEVFVIGATNRPDLLDPALLRPGRFDRLLYLGVSDTHEAQLTIIEALTRNFRLDPQLDLLSVARQCPYNYTGADFYALCSDAMLKAMTRKAQEIDSMIDLMNKQPRLPGHPYPLTPQYYLSELASLSEKDVLVSQIDFNEALQELVASVSQLEMEHYVTIQKRFSHAL
ncbi:AAA-domain-containing protein [Phellopilus nigrolimitatus]|nr:AAA-domain-containing protein [Phellopilus nigrolimitatus]